MQIPNLRTFSEWKTTSNAIKEMKARTNFKLKELVCEEMNFAAK
jgi:hypothetical protein